MAKQEAGKTISRRTLLGGLVGGAATVLLAACGGTATNTPAPSAAASAAPSAAAASSAAASARPSTAAASVAASSAPSAAASAASSAAPSAAASTPAASTAATSPAASGFTSTGKMTYWGGLIFSDDANNLQSQTIKDWGKQNKIDIDVVMINQNETNTKVAAAVEAGTMPDAFDLGGGLLLLLSNTKKLVPLDDLYAKIGKAHGGWLKSVDAATDPKFTGGTRNAIPYGMGGNVLFRRNDVLQKAGITTAPTTWVELSQMAEKVNKPPLYGMGFALSNVGDGNVNVSILQSWGGRIASDDGKTCTLKSAETKAYLEWVTGAFAKGLFPPGAVTWDGAGDNNAYLAGQAAFIANTGSVIIAAKNNKDTELVNSTLFSALPKGPKMQVSPSSPALRAVSATSKNIDASKALIEFLANKEFTQKYYPLAIYGPTLQDETSYDIFKTDPVHVGLADLVVNGTAPAFPDVDNTAYADFNNNFIVPKMIQRVVVDKYDLDRAIDEAQKAGEAIYAKYK